MNCPNCGAGWTLVTRTEAQGDIVIRERYCGPCMLKFETVERVRSIAERSEFQASLFRVLVDDECAPGG